MQFLESLPANLNSSMIEGHAGYNYARFESEDAKVVEGMGWTHQCTESYSVGFSEVFG